MSLQVWLPLNGTLDNQGLDEIEFSSSNISTDAGKFGTGYVFNGSSSKLYATNVTMSDCYTISFWMKPNKYKGQTQWVCCMNINSGSANMIKGGVYINDTSIVYDCGAQGTYNHKVTLDDWYHVVEVFNGIDASMYINGTKVHTIKGTVVNATNLTLGMRSNSVDGAGVSGSYPFSGMIQDFRLYDEVLSDRQIKELSRGLAVHYPMRSILESGKVEDCSGFGYNGLLKGCTIKDSSIKGNIYNFSNTGSALYGLTSPINNNTQEFTIICNVYFNNTTQASTIYNLRTAVGSGIAVFRINSKIRFDDGNLQTNFDYTVPANQWLHVAIVRTSTSKKLYIDGELKQVVNSVGDLSNIGTYGSIGQSSVNTSSSSAGNDLVGSMKDFRIYMTSLSDDDIKDIYEVSARVDDKYNLSTYEFIENDAVNTTDISSIGDVVNTKELREKLSKDYIELEYLESTGEQYINTGFKATNYTNIKLKSSIQYTKITSIRQLIGINPNPYFGINTSGYYEISTVSTTKYSTDSFDDILYDGTLNSSGKIDKYLRVNGNQVVTTTATSGWGTDSLYLFKLNISGYQSNVRIKYFSIIADNELVKYFIPVMRKSDGTLGMLDIYNNVFYTNAGTGDFISGPEVTTTKFYKDRIISNSIYEI